MPGLENMPAAKRRKIRQKLFKKYGGVCQLCLGELLWGDFAVIRKLKESQGGGKTQDNLAIAHVECAFIANRLVQKKQESSFRFTGEK